MSDIGIGTLGASQPDNGFESTALQGLDKEAFLELLVAQMQYQNPLNPSDSNEFIAQAAQFASVEQLENVAAGQAELRSMQMITIATGLVGQEVSALNDITGEMVTGTVDAVRFGSEPILEIDGFDIPLSAVVSVSGAASGAAETAPQGPTPGDEQLAAAPAPADAPVDRVNTASEPDDEPSSLADPVSRPEETETRRSTDTTSPPPIPAESVTFDPPLSSPALAAAAARREAQRWLRE